MKRSILYGVVVGLALFGMLFGASNFLLPLTLGAQAGATWWWAYLGFCLTAVVLPLIGMITLTLFDGDYVRFFARAGIYTGPALLFVCVLVIGFIAAMPRIIWLCAGVVRPFVGISLTSFVAWYLVLNVLGAWYKDALVWILGLVIAPALVLGLAWFIGAALAVPRCPLPAGALTLGAGALYGLATLDLLGMLFFGYMVLAALKRLVRYEAPGRVQWFVHVGLQGAVWCSVLFVAAYGGLVLVGNRHACYVESTYTGVLRSVGAHLFGGDGFVTALFFFVMCYTTSVALGSVVAEYIQVRLLNNRLSYRAVLVLMHVVLFVLSYSGAQASERIVEPVSYLLYPVIITLTVCNLGYALFGLQTVRAPVWLAIAGSAAVVLWMQMGWLIGA